MTTGFIVDAIGLQEWVRSIYFTLILHRPPSPLHLLSPHAAGEEILFERPAGFIIHAVKK
jgi:hypothetical protein